MNVIYLSLFVIFAFQSSSEFSWDGCPEPLAKFRMRKFLGVWYPILETRPALHCYQYNMTEGRIPRRYRFIPIKQPSTPDPADIGNLTIKDPTVPARMTLVFPDDIGTITYTVLATDYDNYAIVFACKSHANHTEWDWWKAQVLSRTLDLKQKYLDEVYMKLAGYNVKQNLERVKHDETWCW